MTRPAALGRPSRWWQARSLHARLALLVTVAVGASVVTVAVLAWAAVGEIIRHQLISQLETDARTIAAHPDQWRSVPQTALDPVPGPEQHRGRGPRDIGPRWQILDGAGRVVNESASGLPVTTEARAVAARARGEARQRVTIEDDSYWMLTVPAAGGGAVQVAINEDPLTRNQNTFGILLVAGSLAGIAVAGLLGWLVARAGLRPVQRLTDAVEDVAVTQDLTRPIEVSGEDEIARLARSVNSMLAAIETSRQAQRTLVEDASHELRTPLTSIRTNIELLLQIERNPESAHRLPTEDRIRLLADLDAQIAELATLTAELVELAREETTREAAEEVDFTDVVEAAVARARIRAPGVMFSTRLEPVTVIGRSGELERMVLNVLDNAAKWSPADGTVHTELTADMPDSVQLRVSDDGPGIDDADRPYIFDRFYRATAARGMPGSGLGLAIVAQTVSQHAGSASADPRTPHGTRVTIRLPAVSPSVDAAGNH